MIRLTIPSIDATDLAAVSDVLASGALVQSRRVAAFEQAVADLVGVPEAVAVSNCTAALHLSLLALGVGRGDLVLVTAYSWIATANVIELCGATPVFVDIDAATFNLSPRCLESALQRLAASPATAGRMKAILPVHAFGQMADLPAILDLAQRYRLSVIEDAACALGATLDGRQAGSWGRVGCFSFHPRKAITTGEGGVVVTRDRALAQRLRAMRNHGLDPAAAGPDFILPGFNYRLTDFQGALGVTQMAKLPRILAARRDRAAIYDDLLAGSGISPPVVAGGNRHVYQSYVVTLPVGAAPSRAELIADLKAQGIEATIGTWHMPMTTYFRTQYGYLPGDFPGADAVCARALTLPLHESLTRAEQEHVVATLRQLVPAA